MFFPKIKINPFVGTLVVVAILAIIIAMIYLNIIYTASSSELKVHDVKNLEVTYVQIEDKYSDQKIVFFDEELVSDILFAFNMMDKGTKERKSYDITLTVFLALKNDEQYHLNIYKDFDDQAAHFMIRFKGNVISKTFIDDIDLIERLVQAYIARQE